MRDGRARATLCRRRPSPSPSSRAALANGALDDEPAKFYEYDGTKEDYAELLALEKSLEAGDGRKGPYKPTPMC